eukprot:NODE_4223_length_1919_cov_5.501116.p1 GENE.NODE_4223_length_1919_cov_5.501116~~NODE_4223_length_1919_cov_5.501116.p1  ORF type:complete len:529 (-),score=160.36 NODE_4223_length_1919_cov_5.501116:200-1786(-)
MVMLKLRQVQRFALLWCLVQAARAVRQRGLKQALNLQIMGALGVLYELAKRMPVVNRVTTWKINGALEVVKEGFLGEGDQDAQFVIPAVGLPANEVERKLLELRSKDHQATIGTLGDRQWHGIYHRHSEDDELSHLREVAQIYGRSDTLYPGTFPAIQKFQAEAVTMAVNLLGGSCGLPASGGTESNFLSMLSYREWGRECGIEEPEVICCSTAHPSVDKAAHFLGIHLVVIDADSELQLNPHDVSRAITSDTVAVFAAAPNCCFGVIDPIEELAAVCRERGVGLHVDNCLGGIHLSCLARLGIFRRGFDFRVQGVTSMAMDLHKYGQASKGSSVAVFRDPAARLRALLAARGHRVTVSPALAGSRSGVSWATAWSAMLYNGLAGYERNALELQAVHERIATGIARIPGLKVFGSSDGCCMLSIGSDELDIFKVSARLEERGTWKLPTNRRPNSISFWYGLQQTMDVAEALLVDLREAVEYVRLHPSFRVDGGAALYSASAALPDCIVQEVAGHYCGLALSLVDKTNT